MTSNPEVSPDDIRLATELAQERYTAARRKYTGLYVESSSLQEPSSELTEALAAARNESLELAAALSRVEDGDPDAVRQELEKERTPEHERARTTHRFSIAELNRAAGDPPESWIWQR